MVTHQSALTSISDFFLSSEVATMWQTDSTAHKLKPRLFHKFAHLQCNDLKLELRLQLRQRLEKG